MTLTPYTLGGASNAPATGTTIAFTLTHAVAAGDALAVSAGSDSLAETVTGITDSQGNTWTSAASDYNQSDGIAVFTCLNAKAMTTSDTITATFSGSTGSHTIVGRGCNGIATGAAVDVAIVNDNAGSTSPSSGASGTLRQASEWAVAFLINANGGGSPTSWTGGFTAASTQHATSNQFHTVADQVVSATTALTAGATIVSAKWAMILVTFRAAPYLAASNAFTSGTTSTAVTIGAASGSQGVASGDAVLVVCGVGSGSVAPTAVTDSASQTYALVASEVAGNGLCSYIYAKYGSASLASGSATVTVTWNSTSNNKSVLVVGASGIATSAAFDQSAGASGSSLAPSSGATPGLAVSGEPALSVIVGGSAAVSVTPASSWVQLGSTLHTGSGVYMAVAQQTAPSTSGVTAAGALAASATWSALAATFQPASGGGGGGGVTSLAVTTTSPLPGGTIGVPYSDQLTAAGGAPPYTWSIQSGSLPVGLILASGSGGSSGSDFQYVGVNTGPQGAPTFAQFQTCYPLMGPIGCYKLFFTSLPATWAGSLMDQITQAYPGVFCYIAWNTQHTQTEITNFIKTIPASIAEVGFSWQSEPENGAFSSGAAFVSGWNDQAAKIQAARSVTSTKLTLITSHFMGWYQQGGNSSYIPPAAFVDVYGIDFYDRKVYWAGPDMSTNKAWTQWTGFVKNLGRPLALTEFGISGASSDTEQNTRLQADWTYLKSAFGPGGSLSGSPLYTWLYWNTGGTTFGGTNINEFLGTQTRNTWAAISATAGNQGSSGGGTGTGGVISGTPTTAGTSTPTIKVTDSAAATATAALGITIAAASALAVTSTSLPGATVNVPYSTLLTATGGTPGYTWAITAGSLPSGMSLASGTGIISGQCAAAGTSSFTVQVTDAASATASASVSITVSAGLTFTTTTLPAGTAGAAYTGTLAAAGGTTPYTWGIASGTIPPGLTLDPVLGIVTGTPTTPGSYVLTFTVTDSAGATATSAQITIAISLGSGGLPALPRFVFGGGESDFGFQFSGTAMVKAAAVAYSFWTAKTAGSQYTDLTDMSNAPIVTGLVTSDSNGFLPEFHAPAGILEMYADSSGSAGTGPRYRITARNLSSSYVVLYNAVKSVTG
jgi:hypothetical protein